MILKQLAYLYDVKHVFMYKERLYEDLREYKFDPNCLPKFRVIYDYDDYNYIEDPKLEAELIAYVAELKKQV